MYFFLIPPPHNEFFDSVTNLTGVYLYNMVTFYISYFQVVHIMHFSDQCTQLLHQPSAQY